MEIGGVIINSGPSTARDGASKGRDAASTLGAEICVLFFCQTLGIVVGIARRKNILGRTNQCHTAEVGAQINLAYQVKTHCMQALAATKIIGTAQCDHRVARG